MNEVEKMYENAGVKPLPTCNNCNMLDEYWSNGTYCSTCKCDKDSDECNMANYIYPPFTTEKQLKLIKWLASKQYAKYTTSLLINIRDTVRFSGGLIAGVCTLNVRYDKQDKEFKNALAGLINEMWQDLTEEEQEQIRSILNGN